MFSQNVTCLSFHSITSSLAQFVGVTPTAAHKERLPRDFPSSFCHELLHHIKPSLPGPHKTLVPLPPSPSYFSTSHPTTPPPHRTHKPPVKHNRDPTPKNDQPPIRVLNPIQRSPGLRQRIQIRGTPCAIEQADGAGFALRDVDAPREGVVGAQEGEELAGGVRDGDVDGGVDGSGFGGGGGEDG
jgi:hypothetical protein